MLKINDLDLIDLRLICKRNKYISYKLEKNYLSYRIKYLRSKFNNHSFIIQDEKKNYCLAIIFYNEKEKKLDFYGHYSELFYFGKIKKDIILKFFEKLNLIKKLCKVNYINFIIRDENILNHDLFKKIIPISNNNETMIDLSNSFEQISKNFKSNLRNELKKKYKEIKYEVINKNNYSHKDIIDMRMINEKINTLEKRPLETWIENEKWILNNESFLIKILEKTEIIGFSMFYFNKITCKYFASCIYTEYFKKYKNLQHLAIWKAIQYIKPFCENFYLGLSIEKSIEKISLKEENIGKFKSKFNKISEKSFVINL